VFRIFKALCIFSFVRRFIYYEKSHYVAKNLIKKS